MQVHYNATYDNKVGIYSSRTNSLCLNTLGQHHTKRDAYYHEHYYPWPYVGGYAPIKEGDSNSCFNCYKIEYGGKSILFRAINSAKDGVDLGIDLFEELSGGKAAQVKHFNATLSMLDDDLPCLLSEQLGNNPLPGAYRTTLLPVPEEYLGSHHD